MLKDLPPILILAIPAMLMSTFVVGLGIWWALDIKLIVALVFGALISATDPVAVVALFKELGAPGCSEPVERAG
jgi:CPA1 family monovalent cation:H+ antiporter